EVTEVENPPPPVVPENGAKKSQANTTKNGRDDVASVVIFTVSWHQLLQVIYGVILSASIDAAPASGVPNLLSTQSSPVTTQRAVWTLVCASFIVVALDAWYQFSLHGAFLRLRTGGLMIAVLLAALLLASFLPLQFVCRVFAVDETWKGPEPVNLV